MNPEKLSASFSMSSGNSAKRILFQKFPVKVLFVCLGNICRSPMAEGLFRDAVKIEGLSDQIECDSCGTSGHHDGEHPDHRMVSTARKKGIDISKLISRRLNAKDFHEFDFILAMDESNLHDIEAARRGNKGKAIVKMMRDFDPATDSISVPDPWFGGTEGFEVVFQILERSCQNFLKILREQSNFK